MSKQLGELFKGAFLKNYNKLTKHSEPLKIVGIEENLKESPIGLQDQYSCFTVIARQINYRGHIEFLNNKPEATTCIEAFSDNKRRPPKHPKPVAKRLKVANKPDKKPKRIRKIQEEDRYGQL
jgi:hypothetical protein